jgi:hypothetical protein
MPRRMLVVLGALLALGVAAPAGATAGGGCANEGLREAQNAAFLPDCRAFELVSPADKGGSDVLANSSRTRVAVDGGAVQFSSLGAFGDAVGTGISTDFMAVRSGGSGAGSNGWVAHAITPPQEPLSFATDVGGLDPFYEGEFSPDLSRGVFRAFSLLSPAPNVSDVENLYLRSDLRSPGAGSYQLLSDSLSPLGPETVPYFTLTQTAPRFAGASADFGHVLFESGYKLTNDNVAELPLFPKLYEWDHGVVRYAGILPDGSAAPYSIAGPGAFKGHKAYTPHVISTDGSKIFFTVPTRPSEQSGTLYMRLDHETTVQLNASERTDCGISKSGETPRVPPACTGAPEPDPNGAQPARYWDASSNGSRVFFTTSEALTDDAPVNSETKLYMYDTTKPDTDPHNLTLLSVDSEPADGADVHGVMGASEDGHYVYFIAIGQLVAGLPSPDNGKGQYGVYLWHDGVVSYVGGILGPDTNLDASTDVVYDPSESRVTPDGKHLLFMSRNSDDLGGYDQGNCGSMTVIDPLYGCLELYVYSADDGKLSCASCNPSGARAEGNASTQTYTHGGGLTSVVSRAISDDGRRVFFTSGDALVPQDTDGKLDVYEYDVPTGTVYLLSSGSDPSDSFFMGASGNGEDAFILTRQRLVGWDTDGAYDLYDVRVGGGFPEPATAGSACVGGECQGPLGPPPSSPSFSSSLLTAGAGNASPVVSKTPKSLSGARRLRGALRACRAHRKRAGRRRCEAGARRRFGKPGRVK